MRRVEALPGRVSFLQLARRGRFDSFLLAALTSSKAFVVLESWQVGAGNIYVSFLSVCFVFHEEMHFFRRIDKMPIDFVVQNHTYIQNTFVSVCITRKSSGAYNWHIFTSECEFLIYYPSPKNRDLFRDR